MFQVLVVGLQGLRVRFRYLELGHKIEYMTASSGSIGSVKFKGCLCLQISVELLGSV